MRQPGQKPLLEPAAGPQTEVCLVSDPSASNPTAPSTELVEPSASSLALQPAFRALPEAVRFRISTYARNTQRALRADWRVWYAWCTDPAHHPGWVAIPPLPIEPATLDRFIRAHSPRILELQDGTLALDPEDTRPQIRSAVTVCRYVSSLRVLHRELGNKDDPSKHADVQATLRLVRRGRMASSQKQPLRLHHLDTLLRQPCEGLRPLRDRAMLTLAYSALLRRSELVALDLKHLRWDPDDGSASVHIVRSKGDQEGKGQHRYVAPFAVEALRTWLEASEIRSGPLFRGILPNGKLRAGRISDRQVGDIFKRMARQIGFDDLSDLGISGHSARIGAAQDMAAHGADLPGIMQAGGWRSTTMPARYAEHLLAKDNAMARMLRAEKAKWASGAPPSTDHDEPAEEP